MRNKTRDFKTRTDSLLCLMICYVRPSPTFADGAAFSRSFVFYWTTASLTALSAEPLAWVVRRLGAMRWLTGGVTGAWNDGRRRRKLPACWLFRGDGV